MHLSATCPRCQSTYQLDPSMRGKRMRCPNAICRAVFEVRDDRDVVVETGPPAVPPPVQAPSPPITAPAEVEPRPVPPSPPTLPPPSPAAPVEPKAKPLPPPPAPPAPPVMPKAEPAPPVAPVEPKAKPAPPAPAPKPKAKPPQPKPVAPPPAPPAPPAPVSETPADFPDDFPGDDAASVPPAPAVATEAWRPDVALEPEAPASTTVPLESAPAPRRRRWWAVGVVGVLLLALGAVGVGAWWRVRAGLASNELERYQRAESLYKNREFADAIAALQKMQQDFAESPHVKKYRFLAELSDVRLALQASESPEETVKTLERAVQFTVVYEGDPRLKERGIDLWETFDDLTRALTRVAESEKTPAHLQLARRAWGRAKGYPSPASVVMGERERKHEDEWARIETGLADHFERQNVLGVLKKASERANAPAVAEAWVLVEKTKRQGDPEIQALLAALFAAHREQVKFLAADEPTTTAPPDEDRLPSLAITPSLLAERAVQVPGGPVLALARGVLYALDPARGELRWARRVGIDTRVAPLRVPADAITPELVLVLSSDDRSLSAVVSATGETLWRTPLSGVCLGTPVRVDRQILVPTTAGEIDEIELAEGRRLGAYHVGEPLTLGGVLLPGTTRAYFPADEFCVYEIDLKERVCTSILYSRHPAGAARVLPTMLPDDKGGWLLWAQATGLEKTVVKPYAAPFQGPEPRAAEPTLHLGRVAAPAWRDGDRLAWISDTGMLSLWGQRQKEMRDPLLYPLLANEFPLDPKKRPGRCQVVHADRDNLWTMTRGGLQRVELGPSATKGLDLRVRWTEPTPLGTLLHDPDARREPSGGAVLFLTTQAHENPTCLASAVDGETGKILWQRQLGAFSETPPLRTGDAVLVASPEGVLRFSSSGAKDETLWRNAGDWVLRVPSGGPRRFLWTTEADFIQMSIARGNASAKIEIGSLDGKAKPRSLEVKLDAALQGEPALGEGFLLAPLANGILVSISLKDGTRVNGPDWRAPGVEETSPAFVVRRGGADFFVADGSRGLQHLHASEGKIAFKGARVQLAHRIVAPPIVLPARGNAKPLVCVRDASDTLTLLDADRLEPIRRWPMAGKISAGPFERDGKIGVLVGKNRLVWLDPEKDAPLWEYAFVAEVVGEPHALEGILVVGDVAGQFHALDPATGRPLGAGLTLKANVAPTAAPLPWTAGHAWVPLTDGTAVVLPLSRLR